MLWYVVVIALLLALSASFSGSETAFFSLTQARRDRLSETRPRVHARVEKLLSQPRRLLSTLLLSNLLVNTTASAIFTLAVITHAKRASVDPGAWLGIGSLVMTGVLLVFGEVTPKVIATRRPEAVVTAFWPLVELFRHITSPASDALTRLSAVLAPGSHEPAPPTVEELHTMIKLGRQRGVLVGREGEILWNLAGLEDRAVSEIMTPRIDVVWLEKNTTIREARRVFLDSGFSRLPVYEDTPDRVVGIAYAKELLIAPNQDAPVCSVCRKAYFVPEEKRLPALLEELRRKGSHIALVVDEFGQTAGLVTLEDVLEAIIGEIADEYDRPAEEHPYRKLDETSYVVDGEIDTATLSRLFDGAFRDIKHKRLAGFISEQLGRLPEPGDTVTHRDLEIVVHEVAGNRLEKVLVRRK